MRISTRVKELLDALEYVEWNSAGPYDDPCCPFCGALEFSAKFNYTSGEHLPDCEWLALMNKWGRR